MDRLSTSALRYQVYDVTPLLKPGDNAIAALLGNGWYCGHIGCGSGNGGNFQEYGKHPALLAQLEVTYADGSVERIVTDPTWKTHASPLNSSDLLLGESYDARQELPGWDQPGFDDGKWAAAVASEEPPRVLESQVMEPVRQTGELSPKSFRETTRGVWIFDLGQNMVGVVRLKVAAPAGTRLTLRHGRDAQPRPLPLLRKPRQRAGDRRILLQRHRRGSLAAAVHLPRFPLCGTHRPARQA